MLECPCTNDINTPPTKLLNPWYDMKLNITCKYTSLHRLDLWSSFFYINSEVAHSMIDADYYQNSSDRFPILGISRPNVPNQPNTNEITMTCPVQPATNHYGPHPSNHPDQKELTNIIYSLDEGASGSALFVMCTDGVLRTLTPDCEVIDAIGLPPRLIKACIDRDTFDQDLEDMFRGADGTRVSQEQWWKPDPSLLPPPMTAEESAWAKEDYEENKKLIQENIRKRVSGETKPCGVVIRSDFDISPK